MAQPYTPAQYPPPPQNGIPAEFAAPHPLPTQDYGGQSRVPEHAMTLYTPTQTHSEPAGTDNSTPAITATTTAPVSVLHHLQTLFSTRSQQVKDIISFFFLVTCFDDVLTVILINSTYVKLNLIMHSILLPLPEENCWTVLISGLAA